MDEEIIKIRLQNTRDRLERVAAANIANSAYIDRFITESIERVDQLFIDIFGQKDDESDLQGSGDMI